jgi:hypothetical protein
MAHWDSGEDATNPEIEGKECLLNGGVGIVSTGTCKYCAENWGQLDVEMDSFRR